MRELRPIVAPRRTGMASLVLIIVLLANFPAKAQERIDELSRQFDAEKEPVRRAKLFPKLGEAQFELLRKAAKADDYEQALTILNAYVDAVNKLHISLLAAIPDPERKPAGFKELESHARKSIRSLDEIESRLPLDEREPFKADRRELESIDDKLLEALFPRRPTR